MTLIFAFLFLLLTVPAAAATRYVSSGSGNTNCTTMQTIGTPGTFDAAVSCSVAGDTILMLGGTYNTYLDTRAGRKNAGAASGTAGNPITVAANPGNCYTAGTIGPGGTCESVTFRPTTALNEAVLMMNSTTQYWTFDGLRINAAAAYQGAYPASNNTFKNMDIFGMNLDNNRPTEAGQGFFIPYSASGVLIDNTKIHDATTNLSPFGVGAMGLYWQGSNSTLQNSEIYNMGGYGMQLFCNVIDDTCTGAMSNNTVRNNKIHNIGTTGLAIEARSQPGATSHKIYNNIIYNNGGRGIGLRSQGGAGHLVYSNTIYGQATAGISLNSGTTHEIKNNIVWGNDTSKSGLGDFYDDGVGGSATATNNLCGSVNGSGFGASATVCPWTSDPLFVNASGGDFHLQAGSPAIDHGTTLSSPYDVDFANQTRFSPFDIGAYERATGACPPSSPALVAAYSFDGVNNDYSGNGFTATLGSGVTYTTGKYGQGLSMPGTAGVTVADADALDFCNGFTLEGWINPSSVSPDFVFINKNPDSKYFLFPALTGYCGSGGVPLGGYSQGGSTAVACNATPLTTSTWVHLAVTYDGDRVALYKDGTLLTSQPSSSGPLFDATTGTLQFCESSFGEFCPGGTIIDEIRLYNYARSAAQIVSDRDTRIGPSSPTIVLKLASGTIRRFGPGVIRSGGFAP